MPKLPKLIETKISKTGQTRGADDDAIYQNRVLRNSTVLIPYELWGDSYAPPRGELSFENGFIVLVSPDKYFGGELTSDVLKKKGLSLGTNLLLFYETRAQWNTYPRPGTWAPATQRTAPLGGHYVARVPATTGEKDGARIAEGFTGRKKGAGIRVYEYASKPTIDRCRLQLEMLFWYCRDADSVTADKGMSKVDLAKRRASVVNECTELELWDEVRLKEARILGKSGRTICPLCVEEVSANGFFEKMAQAEGRSVPDLTVTGLNLFHIEELGVRKFNHRPYNLGWGHHHCNVVARDVGIERTLNWMKKTLKRNQDSGYSWPSDI